LKSAGRVFTGVNKLDPQSASSFLGGINYISGKTVPEAASSGQISIKTGYNMAATPLRAMLRP